MGVRGDQAPRLALYLGYRVTVLVVPAVLLWSVGGYLLTDSGFSAEPFSYGLVVLALTWLAVFVVFVIAKAFRVGAQL